MSSEVQSAKVVVEEVAMSNPTGKAKAQGRRGRRAGSKNARAKEGGLDVSASVNERFHRIFQQLEASPSLQTPLIIGITSSMRGEGRTLIASGLASAISEGLPLPVLLLEADLEQPTLARDLNLQPRGLSEYLRGEIELDDLVQSLSTSEMSVIVAGDCKGAALKTLREERLNRLFGILSRQFAAVVVDLPPMASTGEAARLITQLDKVLMVVEAGSTPTKSVKAALSLIPQEKVAGVLLNRSRSVFGLPEWIRKLWN